MQQKFYQKTWFKNTILISIPCLISFFGIVISVVEKQIIKNTLIIGSLFLLVCLIISVLFFSGQEDKIYKEYNDIVVQNTKLTAILAHMENDYKTSTYTISAFSELVEKWSRNINLFANNVLNNGSVSDRAWDKIAFFDSVCVHCRNMIRQHCNDNDVSKVSVSFVACKTDDNGVKWVRMVAHSNPESTRPNACKDEQKLSECIYHYADLIKDNYSDIEVAVNNEEVRRIFKRISVNTDLSKYTQYIAVPVYCSSNRLLGIFQVVTKYNYIIEEDKIKLIEFASNNIIPYSNLIVLIEKINKGLYINPKQINMENN